MSDFLENPQEEYKKVTESIKRLKAILRTSNDPKSRQKIIAEIRSYEQYSDRMKSLLTLSDDDDEEDDSLIFNTVEYPILEKLSSDNYYIDSYTHQSDDEMSNLIRYLTNFETDYLGLFNKRNLKLDVKYSLERDGYYDRYVNLNKILIEFCNESERLASGDYHSSHENDLLKRRVKMKHGFLIEMNIFFKDIYSFTENLLDDIQEDGILCLNPNEIVHLSQIKRKASIEGMPVVSALRQIFNLAEEVCKYLNIPDF